MEISVGRLNNRMALQVPSELPLGLVFITGRVERLSPAAANVTPPRTEQTLVSFELADEEHSLRCLIPHQVVEETQVESGDRIRVSGHLLFDPRSVHYYLSARDLEVIAPVEPEPSPVPSAVQEAGESAALAQSELPEWVKHLAPPEVQEELGLDEKEAATEDEETIAGAPDSGQRPAEALPEEMLAFLSGAIDSDEEIELTSEMIREYLPVETMSEAASGERSAPTASGGGSPADQEQREAGSAPEDRRAEELFLVRQESGGGAEEEAEAYLSSHWMILLLLLLLLSLALLLALILWNPEGIRAVGAPGVFVWGAPEPLWV